MSTHKNRRGNDPETWRHHTQFPMAHVVFEVCDHPVHGITFAVRARLDPLAERIPPAFCSGFVTPGMAAELRKMADVLDGLEAKIKREKDR